MTAQFNDTVRYADADWHLAGVNGGELFDPARHGVAVRPAGSACWRGFICSYAIADGELRLDDVHLATEGAAPALLGRAPSAGRQTLGFTASYRALAHVVDFTGGLLLGRDFIRELYVHMGFHPAWKYRHVVEVTLDQNYFRCVCNVGIITEGYNFGCAKTLHEQITQNIGPLSSGLNSCLSATIGKPISPKTIAAGDEDVVNYCALQMLVTGLQVLGCPLLLHPYS